MKTDTTSEGSAKPQINTARLLDENLQETAACPGAISATKRYRLVCEGSSFWIKIHRPTPDELPIAKAAVEDGCDFYTLGDRLEEYGCKQDVGYPNQDAMYDLAESDDVFFTLRDSEERELFSESIKKSVVLSEHAVDVAPRRDGATLVSFERFDGPAAVYTLETSDVPSPDDFSTMVYELCAGDQRLTFISGVNYKGLQLTQEEGSEKICVAESDFKESWAVFV